MTIVTECSVCTDQLTNEDSISVMPCGHVFHAGCVTQWLKECKNAPVCPLCRTKAPPSRIIGTIYFSIPNTSMFGSPSKDVSKLTNRISALEANLLRSEALSKETSEQRDKGFERVKKLEAEKTKWKKRDEVERTRLAALKAKVDHFKDERDEFEAKYISSADRLKKLESLETDRNLLDRIEKMRNLNDLDSNQTWLDEFHSRSNVEEMVKYQRLLQKEFTKNQMIIDRQARQITKLEKQLQREHRLAENHEQAANSLKAQLSQSERNLEIVRQKVDLIKQADPNSTTFARLCVESPLSDDMLARVRMGKRVNPVCDVGVATTPAKRGRIPESPTDGSSPDLFATSGNGSGFSDNTFFEQACSEPHQFATPTAPAAKAPSRVLNLTTTDDDEDDHASPPTSPVFGGSRLFQRVRVRTAPIRSPTKKRINQSEL